MHNGFDGSARRKMCQTVRGIKIWLTRNGLYAQDFADSLGMNKAQISKWIHGRLRSKNITEAFREAGLPNYLLKERE